MFPWNKIKLRDRNTWRHLFANDRRSLSLRIARNAEVQRVYVRVANRRRYKLNAKFHWGFVVRRSAQFRLAAAFFPLCTLVYLITCVRVARST